MRAFAISITAIWIGIALVLGGSIYAMAFVPAKSEGAVVVKVCGNLPIFKRADGTIVVRYRLHSYRVEGDWQVLC